MGWTSGRAGGTVAAALLVLGGLAAALVAGELGVRLTWSKSKPAIERTLDLRQGWARPPRAPAPDLPKLVTVFDLSRKNVRGLHKGIPFRTNSRGFRGPEVEPLPAAGVFRIAIAGDSVTMGSGVEESEAYPARLAERLERDGEGRRYEVLNLGLSGLNTTRVVDRVESIGLPLHPDLIVYGYTLNDIEGPAYRSTIPPGAVKAKQARYARFVESKSYLLRAVWPRLLALSELVFERPGTLSYDLHQNYFENPEAWSAVTGGLERLAAIGSSAGVCVHLLVHTGIAQLNELHPFVRVNERIEAAARERGFTVTQTFPYYRGRDPSELRVSFYDTHPNAAGHEIIAEALYDGLRSLPPRCWEKGR